MTTQRPLYGVNVLDFCWVAVGPMTTKYLGEYGATVVRVGVGQAPLAHCDRRLPFRDGVAGINRSGYFASYNANKMGITVDMRHPRAPRVDAAIGGMGPHRDRELHPRNDGGLGLGIRGAASGKPVAGDVQRLDDGSRRADGAPARLRPRCCRRWWV